MTLDGLEQAEYGLLRQAVSEAASLLAQGCPTGGYRCLLYGLQHAEELALDGAGWAEELAAAYRAALHEYACLCRRAGGGRQRQGLPWPLDHRRPPERTPTGAHGSAHGFRAVLVVAAALARSGQVTAGHRRLLAALREAEDALLRQQPGAKQLVEAYRIALREYAAAYGERLLG